MKTINYLLFTAIAGIAASCSSNENTTVFSAKFAEGLNPEAVKISCSELGIDTTLTVVNNVVSFTLPREKASCAEVSFNYGNETWSGGIIPDCAKIDYNVVSKDSVEFVFSDAKSANHGLKAFLYKQLEVRKAYENDDESDDDAYDKLIEFCEQMFNENTDNYLAYIGYMMSSQGKSDEEKLAMIDKMSEAVKSKPAIVQEISCIQQKQATKEGTMFVDFEVEQPDGTVKKFSDYVGKGKYILVDFWASWCGPCMGEVPNLKAAYEKWYGPKFDILSVAVSDKPEASLKAIQEHGLKWNQIVNAQRVPGELYGFNSIPQIFLFGPDGTLIKRDGLRGPGLVDVLAEYIK